MTTNAEKITAWRVANLIEHVTEKVLLEVLGLANLWGANLRDANLWGADLRDANLRDADLWEANRQGALTSSTTDTKGADHERH